MFNLHNLVKSWFSSEDVVKTSSLNIEIEKQREKQDTISDDYPVITEKAFSHTDQSEKLSTIEGNIKRQDEPDDITLESQMDKKLKYSARKNDGIRDEVNRTSVASEMYDQEYRSAYAKAEKNLIKQKDLFEKYIGLKSAKKVPTNVVSSASGLPNNPERFVNFNGVPVSDVQSNIKNIKDSSLVKPMHTVGDLDSIKKLDAAAFYIPFKAASSNKDLSDSDQEILAAIIKKKRELLSTY